MVVTQEFDGITELGFVVRAQRLCGAKLGFAYRATFAVFARELCPNGGASDSDRTAIHYLPHRAASACGQSSMVRKPCPTESTNSSPMPPTSGSGQMVIWFGST
jgi:hypothetical protein